MNAHKPTFAGQMAQMLEVSEQLTTAHFRLEAVIEVMERALQTHPDNIAACLLLRADYQKAAWGEDYDRCPPDWTFKLALTHLFRSRDDWPAAFQVALDSYGECGSRCEFVARLKRLLETAR